MIGAPCSGQTEPGAIAAEVAPPAGAPTPETPAPKTPPPEPPALDATVPEGPTPEDVDAGSTAPPADAERVERLEQALAERETREQGLARAHTAQLKAAELRVREHKDRLLDCEARVQALEEELAERDARLETLEQRAREMDRLNQRLDALMARLPAPEGGTLTAEEARRRAADDASDLRELLSRGSGMDNPRLWSEIRTAENRLHRSQYLLARAEKARTVYRLRPGDSLQQVSRLFYGDGERWDELLAANRHVIQDPDRLIPGATLVVP
jgi:nucleoid-associated protein YgaU